MTKALPTNQRTDQRTDKASYRDARTHLKRKEAKKKGGKKERSKEEKEIWKEEKIKERKMEIVLISKFLYQRYFVATKNTKNINLMLPRAIRWTAGRKERQPNGRTDG